MKANFKSIKHAMIEAELNINGLAKRTHLTPTYVSSIINGKSTTSIRTAILFANALNVEVDEIFTSKEGVK
ncbi:helix-turn-helix transcriptional regulator [Staphylococcus equorum]|uniref:helix-turn-helix transcriptional regulator n=1 Tax=Staphylococcus equorum TaxID=246432 RepID=UPI002DBDA310|nr:helix-turn-helix transcriptional regulator [Staphylococcus equorum]MEB7746540.1 helix-turn-helix transcriptional regulator [Staphylococcus equorum]